MSRCLRPDDERHAVTTYVLHRNGVIKSHDFDRNETNFPTIKLPNEPNLFNDDYEVAKEEFWRDHSCMKKRAPGETEVIGRAHVFNVTPEPDEGPRVE